MDYPSYPVACRWASLLLLLSIVAGGPALQPLQAQHPLCDGQRFYDSTFTEPVITKDVKFGENVNYQGDSVDLLLDVYEPKGDTADNRPVILFAHGGSFTSGSKEDASLVPLARHFTKLGYVIVPFNYRLDSESHVVQEVLGGEAPSNVVAAAFLRAVQDGKAAVRYLRKSVAEMGNPYGIDTNYVYFAGGSAGAILALHLAFWEQPSDIYDFSGLTDTSIVQDLGGLAGNSGHPNYSSHIDALMSIAGAINNLDWIRRTDLPMLHMHGTQDQIVPYESGGLWDLPGINVDLKGSKPVHRRARIEGAWSKLDPWYGAGHVPWANGQPGGDEYLDSTQQFADPIVADFTCKDTLPQLPPPDTADTSTHRTAGLPLGAELQLAPNPAGAATRLQFPAGRAATLQVYDTRGRRVYRAELTPSQDQARLRTAAWADGVYLVQLRSAEGRILGLSRLLVR
jgi:acetyl esterase/lipase